MKSMNVCVFLLLWGSGVTFVQAQRTHSNRYVNEATPSQEKTIDRSAEDEDRVRKSIEVAKEVAEAEALRAEKAGDHERARTLREAKQRYASMGDNYNLDVGETSSVASLGSDGQSIKTVETKVDRKGDGKAVMEVEVAEVSVTSAGGLQRTEKKDAVEVHESMEEVAKGEEERERAMRVGADSAKFASFQNNDEQAEQITMATYAYGLWTRKNKKAEASQPQGVEPAQSNLNAARGDVANAASRGGTDVGSVKSGASRKSIVDSMNQTAASSIGVANGDFNLAKFSGASPEVRSSLSNLALNSTSGYNGLSDTDALAAKTNELVSLATNRNFQDLISSRFSQEEVRDFNLATAGAEIFGNPDLPEIGVAAAQSYILNNLSSAQVLGSSPGLKSLAGKIGGKNGLLLQNPLTLRWLALANELGEGDGKKLPKFLAINREVYQKAYPKLIGWLKGLGENDAMSFLSSWKVNWTEGQYSALWQDTQKSFAGIHKLTADHERQLLKEASGILSSEKEREAKMFVADMDKIEKWIRQNDEMKSKSLMAWSKNTGPHSRLGQIWYENYKDEYQWAHYHKSKMFFAAKTFEVVSKDPAVKQLILDAQEWALFLEDTKPTMAHPLAKSSGN